MGHTYTKLLVHVVFSTKGRAPHIDGELHPRLCSYLGGIVHECGGTAIAINGMPDHVHLLVGVPASVALADMVRTLKTNSSRWVHETWPGRASFAWQEGYSAFSVSSSNVALVQRYIEEQQAHHRQRSFPEELAALLRKHGIAYDERYLCE